MNQCELNVPVFSDPPGREQVLEGYEGGKFDPEIRGAACIVVKVRGVKGVIKTKNREAKWGLNPMGKENNSMTSQPGMRKVPCTFRKRLKHPAPDINCTPHILWLEEDGTLSAAEPSVDNPSDASDPEPDAPPGMWKEAGAAHSESETTLDPAAWQAADQPAASTDDPPAASTSAGVTPTSTHTHALFSPFLRTELRSGLERFSESLRACLTDYVAPLNR